MTRVSMFCSAVVGVLLEDGTAEALFRVGYERHCHFGREYRPMFISAPKRDLASNKLKAVPANLSDAVGCRALAGPKRAVSCVGPTHRELSGQTRCVQAIRNIQLLAGLGPDPRYGNRSFDADDVSWTA